MSELIRFCNATGQTQSNLGNSGRLLVRRSSMNAVSLFAEVPPVREALFAELRPANQSQTMICLIGQSPRYSIP
jgi:hypothetical protein